MRVKDLFKFIKERHMIYERKMAGLPKPWTKDPILQSYRFCNVYRERDTVTHWIRVNWRDPNTNQEDLWFNMVIARLVNNPESLEDIGYRKSWEPQRFIDALNSRSFEGKKVFSGAYIVSTNGMKMPKPEYLAEYVLSPLWLNRKRLRPGQSDMLYTYHAKLVQENGLGSFLAAQVVADLKYTMPLFKAPDWWTWAAMGPGSKRGLNRVMGNAPDLSWKGDTWFETLQVLHTEINKLIISIGMPKLHAQDLQNCLCEFDKYERTRLGEGRPRSTYPGV